jgi:tetratricopeptide (TPR) repeat protein
MVIFAFTGMALFNISLNKERHFALPSALKCARKALRIWQTSLPPEHEDIADATVLVRRLEQAMGIDDALVRRALACSGGDEERAFDLLLSSHVPSLGQSCSASANVGQPVSVGATVPTPAPVLMEGQLRAHAALCKEVGDEAEDMERTRILAGVLLEQERLSEALAMFERLLEFRRRVLPVNHPDIGEGLVRSDALRLP